MSIPPLRFAIHSRSVCSRCTECRPAPEKTASALASHRTTQVSRPDQAAPFQGASCRRSVTVVAVREIAIAVIARIETTESAVETAPEAAVKATPEAAVKATPEAAVKATPEAAVKAAPEAAAVKTTGLGSASADRRGQCESNDRSRQQQLTGS